MQIRVLLLIGLLLFLIFCTNISIANENGNGCGHGSSHEINCDLVDCVPFDQEECLNQGLTVQLRNVSKGICCDRCIDICTTIRCPLAIPQSVCESKGHIYIPAQKKGQCCSECRPNCNGVTCLPISCDIQTIPPDREHGICCATCATYED
ncbi:hypothetical protein PPL_04628 [Heterostelium album PN500]|uniref:Uncharacterized protein n=1 Tax=Heterostelium pallidum (strain ATCC 26659 / Pp 5 / PN500) TaxID=670386 RepID=D3B837_HETP5|nr:hypothetical protein PPL_04628 [Heterostelium album PN500]EFA82205.1 hypothetical protein PPL_04628 [Heterostelium album PN500]|eukprot:XP_020434322.1 hypothetical protein PPL_04628 [Heterostelium album PN500]